MMNPRCPLPLVLFMTASAACSAGADDTAGDPVAGEDVYLADCKSCHGADGAGTENGVSLIDAVPGLTDADVIDTIKNGKGEMAPLSYLSGQEVADVAAYVVQEFGE